MDSVSSVEVSITRCVADEQKLQADSLALEEPLEIRIGYTDDQKVRHTKSISITMRTPGHDDELALGFLFTEAIIDNLGQVRDVKACGAKQALGFQNVIRVELEDSVRIGMQRLQRHFYTSSSCGVCGKTSIAALKVQRKIVASVNAKLAVAQALIYRLPVMLQDSQKIFASTGGLHASALFSPQGQLLFLREDVGRHNALDKVIGYALKNNLLPLEQHILMVSGRASFELIQKAHMAAIQMFVAVGAPSSLAVELARDQDMTLIGFLRDERMNIYHGSRRILQENFEHETIIN